MRRRVLGKSERNYVAMKCLAIISAIFLLVAAGAGQAATPAKPEMPFAKEFEKYPGLREEFGTLLGRFQKEIHAPLPRSQSDLLPNLPGPTSYYAAFPNFGDVIHQFSTIFNDELTRSAVLRDWWQHGDMAKSDPSLQSYLDSFYQLSQYLGDEVVIFGGAESGDNSPVVIAKVRKPGLENFLRKSLQQMGSNSNVPARVVTVQELADAKDQPGSQQLVIAVGPDFAIAGANLKTLRSVSKLLQSRPQQFAASPFGGRMMQVYEGGATMVAGADMHKLLTQLPAGPAQNQEILKRTGFADMKYFVWKSKSFGDQSVSQAELSFTGPRHGVASWLAQPAVLNSLDFVSRDALVAVTLKLKNFAEIFDDVKDLAISSNPAGWNQFEQMQQAMGLNVRQDVFSHLDGEITFELDSFTPPQPAWKAILRVNRPEALQRTLERLLQSSPVPTESHEEGGIVYHTLHVPSNQKPVEINYAYMGEYMVIASGREEVAEAFHVHDGGESLMKSQKFLAAQPSANSTSASAIFYEDPTAVAGQVLRLASPEVASTISQLMSASKPILVSAYGEESAIREVSNTGGTDPALLMVMSAVAVPNLLRARIAANEASAATNMRTMVTAQITYSGMYPQKGYAADLASLGPDPRGANFYSAHHAGILDGTLANNACTTGTWCVKSGFRFTLNSTCSETRCRDYVALATPESTNTGTRNFCASSDGVVRFQIGPPMTAPIGASQCQTWMPLQ